MGPWAPWAPLAPWAPWAQGGPMGPKGPIGPKGSMGPMEPMGPIDPMGPMGPFGPMGHRLHNGPGINPPQRNKREPPIFFVWRCLMAVRHVKTLTRRFNPAKHHNCILLCTVHPVLLDFLAMSYMWYSGQDEFVMHCMYLLCIAWKDYGSHHLSLFCLSDAS